MLDDGTFYEGFYEGGIIESGGEMVFNTAMNGYQELLTDPSYDGQIVVMTYPMIGNYGINPEDVESEKVWVSGFIVKNYVEKYSHYRSAFDLASYINGFGKPLISGIDTRHITISIRDGGQVNAYIAPLEAGIDYVKKKLESLPSMKGLNLVSDVSTKEPYSQKAAHPEFRVTLIDYGVKLNTIRCLNAINADVTVVPHNFSARAILDTEPDGILLSNGPGDPASMPAEVDCLKSLLGNKPIFGICLGHQLLSLALGFETYKLKFGHHGINQPVKNIKTGKVEITSQNHGFCVNIDSGSLSMNGGTVLTHINLNDNTVEGIKNEKLKAFSVQYHPESAPGPRDSRYLFEEFREMCISCKK